jgi:hypothetical protein
MDFSKLSQTEKMATYASVVVVVTALISIARNWGSLMFIPLLAGVAALLVIFAPQIMPNTKLPGSNGSLLTVLGVASVLVWLVVLIDNLGWVGDHIIHWDTFQFVIGLIAAVGLAWYGWQGVQAEGGSLRFGSAGAAGTGAPPPPAAPPQAAPPPAAPPPATPAEPPASTPMADSGAGEDDTAG